MTQINRRPEAPAADWLVVEPAVADALDAGRPVVALESAVITHGLPDPANREAAAAMMRAVSEHGAVPAVIAVVDGTVHVGAELQALLDLAARPDARKLGVHDLPAATALGASGGTTVSATIAVARQTGISVFATGGIGGVHPPQPPPKGGPPVAEWRGAWRHPVSGLHTAAPVRGSLDVSADLPALAAFPGVVVCAGPKSLLDMVATREVLETLGVTIVGFGTDRMPGFYVRDTGLPVDAQVDTAAEVASIAGARDVLGLAAAIIVTLPPPREVALAADALATALSWAGERVAAEQVTGAAVTPRMLALLAEATEGQTVACNLALLEANARLAADIASALGT